MKNTTVNYFEGIKNLVELKQAFRKLLKIWHPDINHDKDTNQEMVDINNQYETLGRTLPKSETDQRTSEEKDIFDGFREIIEKIIHLDDILTIEICGNWIWASGNTYKSKDELGLAGFTFAGKKKMWFWKPADYVKLSHKTMPMEEIRIKYGSEIVKEQRKLQESA